MMFDRQTLSSSERDQISAHLEECLKVFARKDALLTAAELQLKAMLATARRQLDDDAPSIHLGAPAPHHASSRQPVDHLHRGVMANLQSLGQCADRRGPPLRQALDLEQHHILLRLDARGTRGVLAKPQKPSDVIAQIGERFVVPRGVRPIPVGHYITP